MPFHDTRLIIWLSVQGFLAKLNRFILKTCAQARFHPLAVSGCAPVWRFAFLVPLSSCGSLLIRHLSRASREGNGMQERLRKKRGQSSFGAGRDLGQWGPRGARRAAQRKSPRMQSSSCSSGLPAGVREPRDTRRLHVGVHRARAAWMGAEGCLLWAGWVRWGQPLSAPWASGMAGFLRELQHSLGAWYPSASFSLGNLRRWGWGEAGKQHRRRGHLACCPPPAHHAGGSHICVLHPCAARPGMARGVLT